MTGASRNYKNGPFLRIDVAPHPTHKKMQHTINSSTVRNSTGARTYSQVLFTDVSAAVLLSPRKPVTFPLTPKAAPVLRARLPHPAKGSSAVPLPLVAEAAPVGRARAPHAAKASTVVRRPLRPRVAKTAAHEKNALVNSYLDYSSGSDSGHASDGTCTSEFSDDEETEEDRAFIASDDDDMYSDNDDDSYSDDDSDTEDSESEDDYYDEEV